MTKENTPVLDNQQINRFCDTNKHWSFDGVKLLANFQFTDFTQAFGFMTNVAIIAEQLDHHPDWSNKYNQVTIALTTHDSGGVTELDLVMALKINNLTS